MASEKESLLKRDNIGGREIEGCCYPQAENMDEHKLDGGTNSTRFFKRINSEDNPNFTILVVFLAVMVDVQLFTVIDPLLPDLMVEMALEPNRMMGDKFISKPLILRNITLDPGLEEKNAMKIALLVSLKPGLEVLFNIPVGYVIDAVGHKIPMLIGSAFNVIATLSFAYLRNYYLLVIARVFQALGSSLSVVGALALLAATFAEHEARSVASGKAFAGLSVGVASGLALGSIMYQFCGRESPFLVVACLSTIDAIMRLLLVSPPHTKNDSLALMTAVSMLKDRQFLLGLLIMFVQNAFLGITIATLPAHMIYNLHSEQWILGTIFALAAILNIASQLVVGHISTTLGYWRIIFSGQCLVAIAFVVYPFCESPWEILIPDISARCGLGLVLVSVNPMLCNLVDRHHNSLYGVMNGLYTGSYSLGLMVGPFIGGGLLTVIPFNWLYWGLGIFMVLFSFSAICLNNEVHRFEGNMKC